MCRDNSSFSEMVEAKVRFEGILERMGGKGVGNVFKEFVLKDSKSEGRSRNG